MKKVPGDRQTPEKSLCCPIYRTTLGVSLEVKREMSHVEATEGRVGQMRFRDEIGRMVFKLKKQKDQNTSKGSRFTNNQNARVMHLFGVKEK